MTNSVHMLDCLHEVGQTTGIPAKQFSWKDRQCCSLLCCCKGLNGQVPNLVIPSRNEKEYTIVEKAGRR